MGSHHEFRARVRWTGNNGEGTQSYKAYRRDHEIHIDGKPVLLGSADPKFRGDASRHNPEDLLVASLSACHMLWYLHLASVNGIVVTEYTDDAVGELALEPDGGGQFDSVVLYPTVTISSGDPALAKALHAKAHGLCFIARSVNFPVTNEPKILQASPGST